MASEAFFIAALIAASEVAFVGADGQVDRRHVGRRDAERHAGQLALDLGDDRGPTALAAPVDAGMAFWLAPRPPRRSFLLGPSTVGCVAVIAWIVVIRPSSMPKLSKTTLMIGARQLVVQLALDTIVSVAGLNFSLVDTHHERRDVLVFGRGADDDPLGPGLRCFCAPSRSVNRPVDSTT